MLPALLATLGHRSAHSLATGPVTVDPITTTGIDVCRNHELVLVLTPLEHELHNIAIMQQLGHFCRMTAGARIHLLTGAGAGGAGPAIAGPIFLKNIIIIKIKHKVKEVMIKNAVYIHVYVRARITYRYVYINAAS